MFDVVKAAFVLANNGWLGAVLLSLTLIIIVILLIIFKRQRKLIRKTKELLDKASDFDTLSVEFKDFAGEIEKCFGRVHEVLDSSDDKNNLTQDSRHNQITRAQEQLTISASVIARDLAELKGMFNSAMSGIRIGIK